LFQGSWQLVADQAQIPHPGDFLGIDLGVERALVVRDAAGVIHAFRDSCCEAPHTLSGARSGHVSFFQCTVHGVQFELDGKRRGARGTADLWALDLRLLGNLMLVRSGSGRRPHQDGPDPWRAFLPPAAARSLTLPAETAIAADWKLVIEQWLESTMIGGSRDPDARNWSVRSYELLLGAAADFHWHRRFLAPNHLIELRPDGMTILQVLPSGPGHSSLRRHEFTLCEADRAAHAAQYLASRLNPYTRHSAIAVAESTQKGIVTFGHEASDEAPAVSEAASFRRHLVALVPLMALARPPNDI
jgi:phenylpropionate dioxygenase-like ring-hydroxylating dioxygenase large terminal subunit